MSRKQILLRIIPLVVIVFLLIFNSKRGFYNKWLEFYGNDINAIINKIERTRGTKIHYGKEDYFYLENYKGVPLKKGDSIKKSGQEIRVYRKDTDGSDYKLIGTGAPLKPKKSYFAYFFS
jgi:hypothetical protein